MVPMEQSGGFIVASRNAVVHKLYGLMASGYVLAVGSWLYSSGYSSGNTAMAIWQWLYGSGYLVVAIWYWLYGYGAYRVRVAYNSAYVML